MKYLLLTLSVIAVSACGKGDGTGGGALNGSWIMVKVSHEFNGQTFTRPTGSRDVMIRFTGDANGGSLSGSTPANTILSSAYSLGDQQRLTVPAIGHTEVYEAAWGSLFLDHITSANRYQLTRPNVLLIFAGEYILEFRKD
jgi:hypothetical protein